MAPSEYAAPVIHNGSQLEGWGRGGHWVCWRVDTGMPPSVPRHRSQSSALRKSCSACKQCWVKFLLSWTMRGLCPPTACFTSDETGFRRPWWAGTLPRHLMLASLRELYSTPSSRPLHLSVHAHSAQNHILWSCLSFQFYNQSSSFSNKKCCGNTKLFSFYSMLLWDWQ